MTYCITSNLLKYNSDYQLINIFFILTGQIFSVHHNLIIYFENFDKFWLEIPEIFRTLCYVTKVVKVFKSITIYVQLFMPLHLFRRFRKLSAFLELPSLQQNFVHSLYILYLIHTIGSKIIFGRRRRKIIQIFVFQPRGIGFLMVVNVA